MQNCSRNSARGVAIEGTNASRHFIEHDSETEQISPGVEFLATNLLGRHIGHGPYCNSGFSKMQLTGRIACRHGSTLSRRLLTKFRHAEVQQLDLPVFQHKDVRGFHISMDDAFLVCGIESGRDLRSHVEDLIRSERFARDEVLEGLAVQKLHGDKGIALMFADVIDGANIGVVKTGGSLRLALETA